MQLPTWMLIVLSWPPTSLALALILGRMIHLRDHPPQ